MQRLLESIDACSERFRRFRRLSTRFCRKFEQHIVVIDRLIGELRQTNLPGLADTSANRVPLRELDGLSSADRPVTPVYASFFSAFSFNSF